jgi:hypothetical protein
MTYTADPRVDAYIGALPDWQQAICREVRDLVHAADAEVIETIKRTTQPYFVLQGNICALLAAKDHVNVFLHDGAIVPDPEGIITAGHDNKTARTVAVRQGETPNAAALSAMFKQIIANNRAGGWRKLKRPEPGSGGGVTSPARYSGGGGGAVWTHAKPSAAMLVAYEADPDLAALRLDLTDTLREVLEVLIAGLLARSSR